jgi:GntR family transcriptional repressor for pyruvate dehydrogenase complex
MQAIEKVSVVQQVENRIRTYILNNNIKIGDKLPTERELCEELNVGRGTIREAIRILQTKGLVELQPGRGAFVARKEEFDKFDLANWFRENEIKIMDCIEVRTAIEPLAVKLAIQKCSDKDIKRLRAIQNRSITAVREKDIASLAQCDEQFHTLIVECSENKFLIDINKKLNYSLTNFRSKTFNIPKNVDNFIPAHEAIIKAFEKHDPELGQKSLLNHLGYVTEDLEESKKFK